MEQKLWSVALILALLKARLDFHGETDRAGTLEENPLNFTLSVQLSMKPHPPRGPREVFSSQHCKNSTSTGNKCKPSEFSLSQRNALQGLPEERFQNPFRQEALFLTELFSAVNLYSTSPSRRGSVVERRLGGHSLIPGQDK